ncbi:MAG: copper chaperone PCu(A)C [Hyphomonadaceae bacterium]
MRILIATLLSVAAASFVHLVSSRAEAHEYSIGALTIEHPTLLPPPASRAATAGYLVIVNNGDGADRLLSATSPDAERIEIHQTSIAADLSVHMIEARDGVPILPHGRTVFESGGLHLMVIGLRRALAEGDSIAITLRFEDAGEVAVRANVERPRAGAHDHDNHGGHGR